MSKSPQEAKFTVRIVAAFIDWCLVFAFGVFGGIFCGVMAVSAANLPSDATAEMVGQAAGGSVAFGVWSWMMFFAAMNFVVIESGTGSSLGKKLFGLKVYFWRQTGAYSSAVFPSMTQAAKRLALSIVAGIPITVNQEGKRVVRFWHDVTTDTWLLRGTWPVDGANTKPTSKQNDENDQFKSAA